MMEIIEETTMGSLGDVPTGMASMGEGVYTLPDGSQTKGMSCVLAPDEEANTIVGLGSVVDVQGAQWEVTRIEKVRGEPGFVTLERRSGAPDIDSAGESGGLDYRYSTSCPACGARAGWDGGIGEELGEPVMCMRCDDCANEFGWYSGRLAQTLQDSPPEFIPGAEPSA